MAAERDQRARMQMEREKFGRMVASASTTVVPRDRFGATMSPGQLVIYKPEIDVVYQVESVKPILDPKAPPGLLLFTLVARVPLTIQAGANQPLMIALAVPDEPPADPPSDEPTGEEPVGVDTPPEPVDPPLVTE